MPSLVLNNRCNQGQVPTNLVQAVGAFSKVESVILETLADIPEVLHDAKRYIDIYGKYRDHLLEKRTFELYLSILTALTHVMQFFADSSFRKSSRPPFAPITSHTIPIPTLRMLISLA